MTDLTDRMRTCAAHILKCDETGDPWQVSDTAVRDAADLLIEASNALEMVPEPLGEPMALLELKPPVMPAQPARDPIGTWVGPGDILPAPREGGPPPLRPNRVCPQCDSRAAKRVFRRDNKVMLACPVCAFAWEYKP